MIDVQSRWLLCWVAACCLFSVTVYSARMLMLLLLHARFDWLYQNKANIDRPLAVHKDGQHVSSPKHRDRPW